MSIIESEILFKNNWKKMKGKEKQTKKTWIQNTKKKKFKMKHRTNAYWLPLTLTIDQFILFVKICFNCLSFIYLIGVNL